MRTVLLFDVDGTLVLTGGVGRRSMIGAFVKVHGKADIFDGISFGGMTDRAILRHGLRSLPTIEEHHLEEVLEAYLALLEAGLPTADNYQILPGVPELLASLEGMPEVAVGLGTGNVKRGAYAKLARGGIDTAFTFGGFGCDAEDRVELLRTGARRGAELLGAPVESCRVVVIGDTPKDITAAKGIGAPCIAVETGGFKAADLTGAHRIFATLAEDGVRDALFE